MEINFVVIWHAIFAGKIRTSNLQTNLQMQFFEMKTNPSSICFIIPFGNIIHFKFLFIATFLFAIWLWNIEKGKLLMTVAFHPNNKQEQQQITTMSNMIMMIRSFCCCCYCRSTWSGDDIDNEKWHPINTRLQIYKSFIKGFKVNGIKRRERTTDGEYYFFWRSYKKNWNFEPIPRNIYIWAMALFCWIWMLSPKVRKIKKYKFYKMLIKS